MYKRILVSIDGSATSGKALRAAIGLAGYPGRQCTMRLVHVLDEMAYLAGYDPYGGQSGGLIKIMRETGAKVLAEDLAIVKAAGIEADTVLIDKFGARLAEAVAEEATTWQADLIVVGTHGRRSVSRLLLGSGAEQIIRLAPVPVLVVRGQESDNDGAGAA
jgi:nucleotide-binding universal stress UspA family protein